MGTTCSFKLATLFLFVALIFHIFGLVIPVWSTFSVSVDVWMVKISGTHVSGIWKDCICMGVFGCDCFRKIYTPGWLIVVRILLGVGLIGLVFAAFISLMSVCCCGCSVGKIIKGINIFCTGVSGACIGIGVIKFGVKNTSDFENLFSFIELLPLGLEAHGKLSWSFFFCVTAGSVCLVVCAPLFVYDYRSPIQAGEQTANPLPSVPLTPVIIAPPGQKYTFVNMPGLSQLGYIPAYNQQQPCYVQQGSDMQGQTTYAPQLSYGQPCQVMPGSAVQTPPVSSSDLQNPQQNTDLLV